MCRKRDFRDQEVSEIFINFYINFIIRYLVVSAKLECPTSAKQKCHTSPVSDRIGVDRGIGADERA